MSPLSLPSCLLLLPLFVISISMAGTKSTDFKDVKEWGDSFASKISLDLNTFSNFDVILADYKTSSSKAPSDNVDYQKLLEKTAKEMRELLRRRVDSLQASVKAASKLIDDFPFNMSMNAMDPVNIDDFHDMSVNMRLEKIFACRAFEFVIYDLRWSSFILTIIEISYFST